MIWIFSLSAILLCFSVDNSLFGQALASKNSPGIDQLYLEDQQARHPPSPNTPELVYKTDEEREAATRRLLASGDLKSGKDTREAAVIFQHSHQADDYLLAHTLATIAVSKGDRDAIWIAAASLDRYLMAIGKPQIYGTQFMTPAGQHATQEPYNRLLISDELRKQLQVPSHAEQEVRRKGFDTP
jgi:hypothetical protein